MEMYMFWILCLLGVLNLFLLFFIGVYVVRMNDRMTGMFNDLINILGQSVAVPPVENSDLQQKTWDQKFEEEIEAATRRMRMDSGLSDLPVAPSYVSQGTINKKANEGLIVEDK